MKIISVYECDHCTQYLKTRKSIENHEKICFQNPETRSCATCFFLGDSECDQGIPFEISHEGKRTILKTQCDMYMNYDNMMEKIESLLPSTNL